MIRSAPDIDATSRESIDWQRCIGADAPVWIGGYSIAVSGHLYLDAEWAPLVDGCLTKLLKASERHVLV
jgi:hypothetical protein